MDAGYVEGFGKGDAGTEKVDSERILLSIGSLVDEKVEMALFPREGPRFLRDLKFVVLVVLMDACGYSWIEHSSGNSVLACSDKPL